MTSNIGSVISYLIMFSFFSWLSSIQLNCFHIFIPFIPIINVTAFVSGLEMQFLGTHSCTMVLILNNVKLFDIAGENVATVYVLKLSGGLKRPKH